MTVTEVATGVWRAGTRWVNWYLLDAGSEGCVVVDAGLPAYHRDLGRSLAAMGKKPSDVRAVVLTHGHVDHAGMAPYLADAGAPVLCDAQMVASGVTRRRLPKDNDVVCTLNDPRTPGLAAQLGTTRTAAALELWRDRLDGAVVAIGNAPTALFHLLEMVAAGAPRPAAVLGIPVGFIGAVESKDALAASDLEHLVVRGRRGGSAITAAAVNAIASDVE